MIRCLIAIILMTTLTANANHHDPGAPHQTAMEQAKRQATQADRALQQLALTIENDSTEISSLQTAHATLHDEQTQVSRQISDKVAQDPEYQAISEARKLLDQALNQARQDDNKERQKELGQERYRNHVAREKRKQQVAPELVQRANAIKQELRDLQRRLVLSVRDSLADHPQVAPLLQQKAQADTHAAEARAAMLHARGHVDAITWLADQPKPVFRQDHTLPPLTRYGWAQPFQLRKAFAEGWGYALELGGYITEATIKKLDDPDTDEAKTIALVNSDPDRYKLSVICARHFPKPAPNGTWSRDADGNLLSAEAKSYDGTQWHPGMKTVISPLAPDALWQEMARGRAEPLAAVRARAPISIILNGGEYGLGVIGFAKKAWIKDPRIVEAAEQHDTWFDFISKKKAHAETIIADAVREAVPDRDLYIYYTTSGGGHRNRWPGWVNWSFAYKEMHPISDLPSDEHYVNHFNSGFAGNQDILSQAINAAGVQIAHHKPLAYSWFWAKRRDEDMTRYTGFLKCIYMLGTIGGNAGAYHQPDFTAGFDPQDPPYWVEQQVALSRVHALFSHLEEPLRNSNLIPGDYRHIWTTENPAYELLPEELADQAQTKGDHHILPLGRSIRVLARRHHTRPEALVVAWAAQGDTREITVTIPDLGKVKLQARPGGSIYHVSEGGTTRLLDPDQDHPSRTFAGLPGQ